MHHISVANLRHIAEYGEDCNADMVHFTRKMHIVVKLDFP